MNKACLALVLIVLLALAIRVGYVVKVGDGITWPDETEYHNIALNLIHGQGYASHRGFGGTQLGPTAYRLPALPATLAGLYLIFGPHLLAGRMLQAVLGAGLVVLTFLISRQLGYSRKAALLAAIWVGLYPYYIFCAGAVYPVVICTFFLALGTLLLLRGAQSPGWKTESVAGLVLGISSLADGHALAALPFVGLWVLWNKNADTRGRWSAAAAVLLCWVLVITPWAVRNKLVMGKVTLSSAFAYNLCVANGPNAKWDSAGDVCNLESDDVRRRVSHLTEAQAMDVYTRQGLDYIRSNPVRFALLSAGRAANFWRFYPKPASRQVKLAEKLVGALSYGPALLLGMVWLWKERKQWRRLFLFAAYPISAMLVAAVTVSVDRYRLPYDLYLIILASAALTSWFGRRDAGQAGEHRVAECHDPARSG